MELFRDLGERIEAVWSAVDHDEDKFPAIAAEFLREEGNGSGGIQPVHSSLHLWLAWRRPLAGSFGKVNLSGNR